MCLLELEGIYFVVFLKGLRAFQRNILKAVKLSLNSKPKAMNFPSVDTII